MTSHDRSALIENLEHLVEGALSSDVVELDDQQLVVLSALVDDILEKERAGFDKFFESMSQTLKYIPNFLVLAITNKYIEPPIAARITSKLPFKNALAIAKGLSVDYICETALYMEEAYAAQLVSKLAKRQATSIIAQLAVDHPLRLLDILSEADRAMLKLAAKQAPLFDLDTALLSDHRLSTITALERLR